MTQPKTPIDMVLHCPACGLQHIDKSKPCTAEMCAGGCVQPGACDAWTNPPHRSHLCHGCGHIWRPADVPTNGVAAVKTKGKNDSEIKVGATCGNTGLETAGSQGLNSAPNNEGSQMTDEVAAFKECYEFLLEIVIDKDKRIAKLEDTLSAAIVTCNQRAEQNSKLRTDLANVAKYGTEWKAKALKAEAALAAQGTSEPVGVVIGDEASRQIFFHESARGFDYEPGTLLYAHPPAPEQAEVLKKARDALLKLNGCYPLMGRKDDRYVRDALEAIDAAIAKEKQ